MKMLQILLDALKQKELEVDNRKQSNLDREWAIIGEFCSLLADMKETAHIQIAWEEDVLMHRGYRHDEAIA